MGTLLKKNDSVVAIAGRNRGKKGRVLAIYPDKGRILVEGINFIKKSVRPSQKNPQGGFEEKEAALALSNVMLFCGKCQSRVRVGTRFLKDGTKERFCKKCQEAV